MSGLIFYKLKRRKVIPWEYLCCTEKNFRNIANRRVRFSKMGKFMVSTIFLFIDHNFTGEGPPVLFETAIHDGHEWEILSRASTHRQALKMHLTAKSMVKNEAFR